MSSVKIANEIRTQALAESRWPAKEQTATDRVVQAVEDDIKFRDSSAEFYKFCGIGSIGVASMVEPERWLANLSKVEDKG